MHSSGVNKVRLIEKIDVGLNNNVLYAGKFERGPGNALNEFNNHTSLEACTNGPSQFDRSHSDILDTIKFITTI